jgi:hypothetical protein
MHYYPVIRRSQQGCKNLLVLLKLPSMKTFLGFYCLSALPLQSPAIKLKKVNIHMGDNIKPKAKIFGDKYLSYAAIPHQPLRRVLLEARRVSNHNSIFSTTGSP